MQQRLFSASTETSSAGQNGVLPVCRLPRAPAGAPGSWDRSTAANSGFSLWLGQLVNIFFPLLAQLVDILVQVTTLYAF